MVSTTSVEPCHQLAVDLPCGFEFLGALGQSLSSLEEHLLELGDPGGGGIALRAGGSGGEVVGHHLVAQQFAQPILERAELGFEPVVERLGVLQVGA